jgi:hypothetical protein
MACPSALSPPMRRSVRRLHIQPCPVSGKSRHIRRFLNDLVGGLARSMTRARLNADKVGLGLMLKVCSIFG